MKKSLRSLATTALATLGVVALSAPAFAVQGDGKSSDLDLKTSTATVNMGGSTFDQPLIGVQTGNLIVNGVKAYGGANPKVTFSPNPYPTSGSNSGSGYGRNAVTNNAGGFLATIGFSDQPMASAAGTVPSGVTVSDYVQVPFLLGGAVMTYNLPGVSNLKLTPAVIAQIFDGAITSWKNPQIVALQGGAASTNGKLLNALSSSDEQIKVAFRSGGGGTNYAFENYLNDAYLANKAADSGCTPNFTLSTATVKINGVKVPSQKAAAGVDMTAACYWPGNVPQTLWGKQMDYSFNGAPLWDNAPNLDSSRGTTYTKGVESGNGGMVTYVENNVGAIGYVEASYVLLANDPALQVALLPNAQTHKFIKFSVNGVIAAAANKLASGAINTDDFDINNQADAAGKAWPFATFSWAIVPKSDNGSGAQSATNLEAGVKYLDWATHAGQKFAPAVGYAALPTAVQNAVRNSLNKVMCGATACLAVTH